MVPLQVFLLIAKRTNFVGDAGARPSKGCPSENFFGQGGLDSGGVQPLQVNAGCLGSGGSPPGNCGRVWGTAAPKVTAGCLGGGSPSGKLRDLGGEVPLGNFEVFVRKLFH